jgi:putative endonuclease
MSPATAARRAAFRLGVSAERRAAWLLRLKGFRILAVRVKLPVGEIDLIAARGRLVVFVEVKARPDAVTAIEAVTPRARARIARAADAWIARRPRLAARARRFDMVLVTPRRWPIHIADAFRPDDPV